MSKEPEGSEVAGTKTGSGPLSAPRNATALRGPKNLREGALLFGGGAGCPLGLFLDRRTHQRATGNGTMPPDNSMVLDAKRSSPGGPDARDAIAA